MFMPTLPWRREGEREKIGEGRRGGEERERRVCVCVRDGNVECGLGMRLGMRKSSSYNNTNR